MELLRGHREAVFGRCHDNNEGPAVGDTAQGEGHVVTMMRGAKMVGSSPLRRPGAVMAGAGATFLTAAFLPVSAVYTKKTAAGRLDVLRRHPGQWRAEQVGFAAAIGSMPVGLALLARTLRPGRGRGAALAAAGAFALAAPVWSVDLVQRVRSPESFARGDIDSRPFYAYTALTLVGLALVGEATRRAGFPRWFPILDLGAAGALSVALLATRDLPPFAVHAVLMANGIGLVRADGAAGK